MRVDYNILFRLRDAQATRPGRLSVGEDARFRSEDFDDLIGSLFEGEKAANPPLELHHHSGGQLTDVAWTDFTPITVISQRVVDLFREQGFTGWNTYGVEVHGKDRQEVPSYHGLAITGRTGSQDPSRGILINKPPIAEGGVPYRVLKGISFQDDYWDGSDFCLMDNTYMMIVTEKVVRAFKHERIRNVEFIALPEHETDVSHLR